MSNHLPEVKKNRTALLKEANELINGDRHKDYGDASDNFRRIAAGWSEIVGKEIKPHEVALMMDWLKTCRLITSPDKEDSWVDKIGYGALGGELALNARKVAASSGS